MTVANESQTFALEIITPTTTQQMMVEWVEIESPTGSFLVGPNHCPLLSIIRNQSCVIFKDSSGNVTTVRATHGIICVDQHKATVILDQ